MTHRSPRDSHAPPPDWEAIARHFAGEDGSVERAAMESALAADPSRRALIEALRSALRGAGDDAREPTAQHTEEALRRTLARPAADSGDAAFGSPAVVSLAGYRARWRAARRLAAAAVVLVAGGGMLWRMTRHPDSVGTDAQSLRFATATRMMDTVSLSDGTLAVLGPESELVLATSFNVVSREVRLRGQAHFVVAHDERRPFVVRAGSAVFRDVGTTFDVQTGAADTARLLVIEGAVAIDGLPGQAPVLNAGDRATVSAGRTARIERHGVTPDDVAWSEGRLVFRDTPVADVSTELRRWFGLVLVVRDETLAARRLTATFGLSAPGEVGGVIAASLGGASRRTGDTLFIMPLSPSATAR